MAPPLHRHQLVRLTDAGWRELQDRPWDDESRACVAHWAARRLPLVVTRQPLCIGAPSLDDELALGLAAPSCWQRRRIALALARRHVASFDEFPGIDAFVRTLSARCRPRWRRLVTSLAAVGAAPRVYGSHGWQCLTGLAYVHARSDIDLWTAVADAAQADAVAALFDAIAPEGAPRLDGELVFPNGEAVAWREWRDWRAGRCRTVLAKTLAGASLVASW